MAEFCQQCLAELGAPPTHQDFTAAGLELCEGCGFIEVDKDGKCIDKFCKEHKDVKP